CGRQHRWIWPRALVLVRKPFTRDPPQGGDERGDVVGLSQVIYRAVFQQADGLIDIARGAGKDDRRQAEGRTSISINLLNVPLGQPHFAHNRVEMQRTEQCRRLGTIFRSLRLESSTLKGGDYPPSQIVVGLNQKNPGSAPHSPTPTTAAALRLLHSRRTRRY